MAAHPEQQGSETKTELVGKPQRVHGGSQAAGTKRTSVVSTVCTRLASPSCETVELRGAAAPSLDGCTRVEEAEPPEARRLVILERGDWRDLGASASLLPNDTGRQPRDQSRWLRAFLKHLEKGRPTDVNACDGVAQVVS